MKFKVTLRAELDPDKWQMWGDDANKNLADAIKIVVEGLGVKVKKVEVSGV